MADYEAPHLQWPLRLEPDGSLAAVEQDTLEDVEQCVHVLLRTERGSRPLAPAVGVEDPTFDNVIDPGRLSALLEEQEDRARVTVTVDGPDETGEVTVRVSVALRDDPSDDAEYGDAEV